MAKLKLRIPADLVVDLDLGDPVVRVPHWRTWPSDCPKEGEDLLLRFRVRGSIYDMIGFLDGPEPRGGRPRFRGCAKFDGHYWDFRDMAHLSSGETVRFRPWEDKE